MTYCDLCYEDLDFTGLVAENEFVLCDECEGILDAVNAEFVEEDCQLELARTDGEIQ